MQTGRSSLKSVLSTSVALPGYRVKTHIIELPYILPLIYIERARERSVKFCSGLIIYDLINIPRWGFVVLFAFNFDKVHPLAILSWYIFFILTYAWLRLFNRSMIKWSILPHLLRWSILNWKVLQYFRGPLIFNNMTEHLLY